MKTSKVDGAWRLFSSLMRNYPLWPCTFSQCDCERSSRRGGEKCHLCLREELASRIGMELAERADKALAEVVEAWALIRRNSEE